MSFQEFTARNVEQISWNNGPIKRCDVAQTANGQVVPLKTEVCASTNFKFKVYIDSLWAKGYFQILPLTPEYLLKL